VLRQRVITAVLLLAAFLAAAAAGRSALDASLAILIGAATFEWLRLAKHPTVLCVAAGVVFAGALLAAQVLAAGPLVEEGFVVVLLAVACVAWLGVTALVLRGARRGARLPHWLSTVLAFVLLGAAWLALMRLLDGGVAYMLSVLVIVWLADIAAYFAGRQWGRRKLAPAISPGKTWAGVAGAAAAVTCMAVLLARVAPEAPAFSTLLQQRLGVATALAVLAALVALSIMGDLFESMLKRQVDAKDSSHLLPGHGGVLDRIDALIAVLPAAALLDLWLRR
jgi:phosphatidate cytidylyltransferase